MRDLFIYLHKEILTLDFISPPHPKKTSVPRFLSASNSYFLYVFIPTRARM